MYLDLDLYLSATIATPDRGCFGFVTPTQPYLSHVWIAIHLVLDHEAQKCVEHGLNTACVTRQAASAAVPDQKVASWSTCMAHSGTALWKWNPNE